MDEQQHDRREKDHWSLDKRVPLALIVSLALQTSGVIWWASRMSSQQENMTRRLEAIEAERSSVRIAERLAVLESQMTATNTTLGRLEAYLRRVEERRMEENGLNPRNGRHN